MADRAREGEFHLFILWSAALPWSDPIYEDLERHFELIDSFTVRWESTAFRENLLRLYGFALPERIDKATGTGTDPFHVIVVRDVEPMYAARLRSWGIGPANARMYDAKNRYRSWTGGSFRVHATIDRREAERDLFMLTGRRIETYVERSAIPWTREPTQLWDRDVVGTEGWESLPQLLTALEVCLDYVLLWEQESSSGNRRLTLLVDDARRAILVVTGRLSAAHRRSIECQIAGRTVELVLREYGDGTLDRNWQRALLRYPVRLADGTVALRPQDQAYCLLYELVARARCPPPGSIGLRSATSDFLPPGDYGDPTFARAVLEEFLWRTGYGYALPRERAIGRNPDVLGRRPRMRRALRRKAPRIARLAGRVVQVVRARER